jgi:hypothetical protein
MAFTPFLCVFSSQQNVCSKEVFLQSEEIQFILGKSILKWDNILGGLALDVAYTSNKGGVINVFYLNMLRVIQ